MLLPETRDALQQTVCQHPHLCLRGGGTKPALSRAIPGAETLELTRLSGVVEYDPAEYTFTALAGTRVAEVQTLLEGHGQYLPFDPPWTDSGATLGGTVASGLSGPGRYRYGGVRDFILGVGLVDGTGKWVQAGGKVVKNAAGYDIPKLVAGSLGELGVLVELTFKVFPQADAHLTVEFGFPSLDAAMEALYSLYTAQLDIVSLDVAPGDDGSAFLWVRIGGLANALLARADRIRGLIGGGEVVEGAGEVRLWRDARELAWVPSEWSLMKVPLTPSRVAGLEKAAGGRETRRRYSSGANVAWIATPESPEMWDGLLSSLGLEGLVIRGSADSVRIGTRRAESLERRVKEVFDPTERFSRK
jgi:glycolate oxidase FAD binding subunit